MIGDEIRRGVFRDTKNFYENADETVYGEQLIAFAVPRLGHTVLDIGCATGNYCALLSRRGFTMTGADVNPVYVEKAKARGIDAHLANGPLPFADASFDSAIIFEVLEHVPDAGALVKEARRVTRKNVLITVPNSSHTAEMKAYGILYEHFADLDHKNFFTRASLQQLLSPHFTRVTVTEGDPLHPSALFSSPLLRFIVKALVKLRLVRPRYFFRLYAVAEI